MEGSATTDRTDLHLEVLASHGPMDKTATVAWDRDLDRYLMQNNIPRLGPRQNVFPTTEDEEKAAYVAELTKEVFEYSCLRFNPRRFAALYSTPPTAVRFRQIRIKVNDLLKIWGQSWYQEQRAVVVHDVIVQLKAIGTGMNSRQKPEEVITLLLHEDLTVAIGKKARQTVKLRKRVRALVSAGRPGESSLKSGEQVQGVGAAVRLEDLVLRSVEHVHGPGSLAISEEMAVESGWHGHGSGCLVIRAKLAVKSG